MFLAVGLIVRHNMGQMKEILVKAFAVAEHSAVRSN
jgi:hypothetical protein